MGKFQPVMLVNFLGLYSFLSWTRSVRKSLPGAWELVDFQWKKGPWLVRLGLGVWKPFVVGFIFSHNGNPYYQYNWKVISFFRGALGWWLHFLFNVHPYLEKMNPIWLAHIFFRWVGKKHHQPEKIIPTFGEDAGTLVGYLWSPRWAEMDPGVTGVKFHVLQKRSCYGTAVITAYNCFSGGPTNSKLGGGFNDVLFSPLFGQDSHFD